MLASARSVLPVRSHKRVVHQATYVGRSSSSSIFLWRLSGDLSARKATTSSAAGSVPVRSRLTRRRNSPSLQTSDGTIPNLLEFFDHQPVDLGRRGHIRILGTHDVGDRPHDRDGRHARIVERDDMRIARLDRFHEADRIDRRDLLVVRLIAAERSDIFAGSVGPVGDRPQRDAFALL